MGAVRKTALQLLAVALLSNTVAGCGESVGKTVAVGTGSTHAATTSAASGSVSTPTSTTRGPRNESKEGNTYLHGADDLVYSHVGGDADKRAMTAVLKVYYAAAAAGDGAKACSVMYSVLAEEIPETYGASPPGPPELHGRNCAAVMSKFFHSQRQQLIADHAALKVTLVRVREHSGLAVLKFGNAPERDIRMHREGGRWKVNAMIDSAMT